MCKRLLYSALGVLVLVAFAAIASPMGWEVGLGMGAVWTFYQFRVLLLWRVARHVPRSPGNG